MNKIKNLFNEAVEVKNNEGTVHLLKRFPSATYRRAIRPLLPITGYVNRNGVPTEGKKLFDDYLPQEYHYCQNKPNSEQALVDLHNEVTMPGDDVVIIGGGYGVTMYYSSRAVGDTGSVIIYEAANERLEILYDVINRLEFTNKVKIRNAIIGEDISVSGSASCPIISPKELPPCDILELDCEGAEGIIVSEMTIRPRDIFVEIHPDKDKRTYNIVTNLKENGYTIRRFLTHDGEVMSEEEFEYVLDMENKPRPVVWARHLSP